MDVREKLVEMLQVDLSGSDGYEPELIADYMLDHGVTVQEWISVEDRFPTFDTVVLIFARGYVEIGWYDGNHDEWRTGITTLDNCDVTHWMNLPQPPEGE